MKLKNSVLSASLVLFALLMTSNLSAENEERDVPAFSKIALKIDAKVHVEQGKKQSVEIVAKPSVLEDLITDVNSRTLTIRFPASYLFKNINAGKIEIFITVPEIDGLSVSGSGDILAEDINSRIIDLAVSGSGDIVIDDLAAERVSAAISGSGDIMINGGGVANELSVTISGSGNVNAKGFEADKVKVWISGSGDCQVSTNGSINARIAGSGNVVYKGNPAIDATVAGSGKVREM